MNKRFIIDSLAVAFITTIAFTSCKTDLDLGNISPEIGINMGVALPVGSASATLGDFLTGGESEIEAITPYIGIEDDGSLYAKYQYTYNYIYHSLAFMNNTTVVDKNFTVNNTSNDLWSTFPVNINGGQNYTMEFDIPIVLSNINDNTSYERLDSARITQASFTSNFSANSALGLNYSDIVSMQIVLPDNFSEATGAHEITLDKGYGQDHEFSVNNFTLKIVEPDGTPTSQINVKFRITIRPTSNMTIYESGALNYKFIINFIDYEIAYGNFQPDSNLGYSDTLSLSEISGLQAIKNLVLPFTNPTAHITATTTLGVPVVFNINYAKATSADGEEVSMIFSRTQNTTDVINLVIPTTPYDSATTYVTFNKDNGQLDKIFSIFPDKLYWSFDASVDRNSTNHFMLRDNNIRLKLDAKIPLEFNPGVDISYQDTIKDITVTEEDLAKYQISELDSTTYAIIYIKPYNGLPFDVDATFTFLDADGNILDLLVNSNSVHIPAATDTYTENNENYHKQAEAEYIKILAKGEDINKIALLKSIAYRATLTTDKERTQHAELFKSDKLTLTVSLAAQANMTLNIDSISK